MPLQAGTKGAARKITGGKYCGLNCWIDDSRRHPETQVYVCVQLITGEDKAIWTKSQRNKRKKRKKDKKIKEQKGNETKREIEKKII